MQDVVGRITTLISKELKASQENKEKKSGEYLLGKNADKQFEKDFKAAKDLGVDLKPFQQKRREIQKAVSDVEKAAEIMVSKVKI